MRRSLCKVEMGWVLQGIGKPQDGHRVPSGCSMSSCALTVDMALLCYETISELGHGRHIMGGVPKQLPRGEVGGGGARTHIIHPWSML